MPDSPLGISLQYLSPEFDRVDRYVVYISQCLVSQSNWIGGHRAAIIGAASTLLIAMGKSLGKAKDVRRFLATIAIASRLREGTYYPGEVRVSGCHLLKRWAGLPAGIIHAKSSTLMRMAEEQAGRIDTFGKVVFGAEGAVRVGSSWAKHWNEYHDGKRARHRWQSMPESRCCRLPVKLWKQWLGESGFHDRDDGWRYGWRSILEG